MSKSSSPDGPIAEPRAATGYDNPSLPPKLGSAMDSEQQSVREISNDGTVILPDQVFKSSPESALDAPLSLIPHATLGTFPHFPNGDVIILAFSSNSMRSFQLHYKTLMWCSPWFARSLQTQDPQDSFPLWFSYMLTPVEGSVAQLVRQLVTGERPHINAGQDDTGVKVKSEDAEEDADMNSIAEAGAMVLRPLIDSATVEAYGQVLGLFYNIPLRIATNEVKAALSQSEMIVRVATALECLPLVRPHVSNAIADYRQQLYRAIKADPVRWTLLAQSLQNEPLFTECFVHLVGAYPLSPWPTKRNALTNELRQRITTRSKALDQICLVVDRELLMLTIEVGDSPVAPNDSQNKETWLLVQLFRDAISRQLHTLDDKRRALSCGTFYRKLARGGSNYMDYEEISKLCASLMNSDWRDLGEELKLLKQYASRAVQVLASNELMLDPDANDVGYLTCVKVGKQDFPW